MKAIWESNTPYSKFLISVGFILISAVLFTFISTIGATLIYGISMVEMQNLLANPTSPLAISVLKFVQLVSSTGTFLLPPFILALLFSSHPTKYLSLDVKPEKYSFLLVAILMIVATPMINFLGEINSYMHLPGFLKGVEDWMRESEDKAAQLTEAFLKMKTTGDFVFNLIMIGLLPAIGEELVFRGVVQKIFHQWSRNIHVAIWTTAFVFSAMHMQFYGFLPRMVLGGMLGYMLAWSGSLWLPIFAHFVNNAGAVVFMYLFQQGMTSIDPDKIGTESELPVIAFSLLLSALCFLMLYKRRRLISQEEETVEMNN